MLLLLQRFPGEGVGGNGATERPLVVCIDRSPEPGMAFSFSPSPMSHHSGLKLSFFETIFVWGQDHVDCSIDILPQIVFGIKTMFWEGFVTPAVPHVGFRSVW